MFDSIIIRNTRDAPDIFDVGIVAEAILYYRSVHLLVDYVELFNLLLQIGILGLEALLFIPHFRLEFLAQGVGVTRDFDGPGSSCQFGLLQFGNPKFGTEPREVLISVLIPFLRGDRRRLKTATLLAERIVLVDLNSAVGKCGPDDILRWARLDLDDSAYVNKIALLELAKVLPNLKIQSEWDLRVLREDTKFSVQTNLPFNHLNEMARKDDNDGLIGGFRLSSDVEPQRLTQGHRTDWSVSAPLKDATSNITIDVLVGAVLGNRLNLSLAAMRESEMAVSPVGSEMLAAKLSAVAETFAHQLSGIELFEKASVEGGRSIREAVNAGDMTLADIAKLAGAADRFRNWAQGLPPDKELVSQYIREMSSVDWLERLPVKIMRFCLFTGAGILSEMIIPSGIGTAAGVALGAGDAFFLKRLIGGWNPSQFVNGPLQRVHSRYSSV